MHSAAYAVARCVSVRLSVSPSVRHTPVFCLNGYTYHQIFSQPANLIILVFPHQTRWQYSDGTPPLNRGVECNGGMKNHDFRPISRFISEMMQDSHSYYGWRIANHIHAFKWYQFEWFFFEWPLTKISRSWYYSTSNNSKTVQDRAIPTESRTWSIERRHFQWPWTTRNPVFKVTLFFDAECLINGWRYGHTEGE